MDGDVLRAQVAADIRRMISSAVLLDQIVARRLGLGATDAQALTLLDVHGPLTAGRLAELTNLSTGTVTAMLDRLEKTGFIRRRRDALDRRRVLITIARDAEATIASHYGERYEQLTNALRRRHLAELRVIVAFLDDMAIGDPPS